MWSVIASVSTTLGFGVVIVGTLLASRQLREMTRTRHLEAMLRIYELLAGEGPRSARRFIYTQLKNPPESVTAEEREQIEKVSIQMDTLGRLVSAGLVPTEQLLDGHAEVFIRAWTVLQPYVVHHRRLLGSRHGQSFEYLAGVAKEYELRHDRPGAATAINMWN